MPNKVFISYRREDSRYQARRIYDAFVHALPPDTVFMDVDSIPPGADFVEILEGWVQQCDVQLALIGPRWVDSVDPRTNLRRLDNPEDFVRIEIRGALERKIPVVPVLLDAAQMPTAVELPDDIRALRRRHAEFVDFRTFDADVQRLIKGLKIGKKIEPPVEAPVGGRRLTGAASISIFERVKSATAVAKPLIWAAAAALLLVAGVFAYAVTNAMRIETGGLDFTRASQATDAMAVAEKARQEAEAKATAAVAALARTEENRRAAEARANDAADALKKSDKARLDAEAQAAGAAAAQAKAEEGQRTADKARSAAEAAANALTDTLARNEKARQETETAKAETTKAGAPAKVEKDSSGAGFVPVKTGFLADIGSSSRWAMNGPSYCGSRDEYYYSLTSDIDSITWTNSYGAYRLDNEAIIYSGADEFATRTRTSRHAVGESFKIGTTWNYSREGERMRVKSSIGHNYTLTRCP
jgi:hypothetical protein